MAPAKSNLRRSQQQNERIYELGVQGRKTGVTLRDTGVRDEHGMQPIDDIFSSPGNDDTGSDDGEADMDLTTASGPIPLINGHNGNRLPVPRSRSPIKTNLRSPAIRNPHLARRSSPTPGSGGSNNRTSDEPANPRSAKRRLDFSNTSHSLPKPSMSGPRANGVNGYNTPDDEDEDEDEEAILHGQLNEATAADDSMQMIGNDDPDDVEEEEEEEEEEEAEEGEEDEEEPENDASREDEEEEDVPMPSEDDEPVKVGKKRGRPAKNRADGDDSQTAKPPKRRREQEDSPDVEPDAAEPEPKKQRKEAGAGKGRKPAAAAAAAADASAAAPSSSKAPGPAQAPRKRGRKRKSDSGAGVGDTSVVVPRGPPLPKRGGLVITRREVPGEGGTLQTRSGRTSYRPLAFWRNEHVDYDQGEVFDDAFAPPGRKKEKTTHFVLPSIKEIHRVDEDSPPPAKSSSSRRKGGGGAGRPRRRRRDDEEDDDDNDEPAEPWEDDPGEIYGEVIAWEPEHEFNPPSLDEVRYEEDRLALSRNAVRTDKVRSGSFGFVKTLSLPYFGAGALDLPPGSEKKTKNSRRFHLTFFVFTGRVLVTINNNDPFRISKGGNFFIPRGNFYSIENDYDHHSRLFFAQAAEVPAELVQVGESATGD